MNRIIGQRCQLGKIATNKFTLRVEFFTLADGVENSEIGLCIATTGTGPLPTTIVGGQIKVDQMLGEILFAPAPVDTQILD